MGKTVAFVPVRGGSKSIPLKNIKPFCGKPLVYWVLNELSKTEAVDEIVVATDSETIKSRVLELALPKVSVYDRDEKNAQDTSSTESVMLEYIEKKRLDDNDIFLLVQATSPFTQQHHFEEALKQLNESNKDSLLTCARTKRFFWNDDGTPLNYDFNNRPRRQQFRGTLIENGAFYINSVINIKKHKNRLSGAISIYEMPEYTVVEIDEEEDWIVAEYIMKKHVLTETRTENIKLFLTDVDGVLTDAGMYYSEKGDELKKFNTKDGKAFELMRKRGIKTGFITSEDTKIVENRAKKLKIDYLRQGVSDKVKSAQEICKKENITLKEVAYIGDDINDLKLLNLVGIAACPADAVEAVKKTCNIHVLDSKGGDGCIREFYQKFIQ